MTNDFRFLQFIYIVYDCKNENHWSLLIPCYSLLGIQTSYQIIYQLNSQFSLTLQMRMHVFLHTIFGNTETSQQYC